MKSPRARLAPWLLSSPVVALLIGGGAPPALAACSNYTNTTAPGYANSAVITGITINNSTVTSGITNSGTISSNGILLENASTITGSIVDTGTLAGGINIQDSASKILGGVDGILIEFGVHLRRRHVEFRHHRRHRLGHTTNWTAIAKFDGEFASDRANLFRHRHAEI